MPKITNASTNNQENAINRAADPSLWGWDYPVGIKKIGDLHLAVDNVDPNHAKYGLFLTDKIDPKQCVSAIDIKLLKGSDIGLPHIKTVPMVEMIATAPQYRRKGYAETLYTSVINKYKVLISDSELKHGTHNIWTNTMPKLGTVMMFDINKNKFLPLDATAIDNENIRYAVVTDENIIKNINENWFKKTLASAAMAGALATGGVANAADNDNATPNFKTYFNNGLINIDYIVNIESHGDPNAVAPDGGRGLCQFMPATWEEEVNKMKKLGLIGPDIKLRKNDPVDFENAFVGEFNKQVAQFYFNVTIPDQLKRKNVPVTLETIIASYNAGAGNVSKSYKKYGEKWLKNLHFITNNTKTQEYIVKYKTLKSGGKIK